MSIGADAFRKFSGGCFVETSSDSLSSREYPIGAGGRKSPTTPIRTRRARHSLNISGGGLKDFGTSLFKTFKKWGFETVEIPIEDPSHIDPGFVRKELDRLGLVCGSACACMGPGRDFRGTPAEQETAMNYCKALLDQM